MFVNERVRECVCLSVYGIYMCIYICIQTYYIRTYTHNQKEKDESAAYGPFLVVSIEIYSLFKNWSVIRR